MKYSAIGLIITFGAFRSCLGVETKECRTDASATGDIATTLDLHNPEQLDAFEGCTILKGHIVIQADYEGHFSLDGITSFQGNISTIEDGVEGLGLFELEKLREIDHLHLFGLSGDVKMPKLESIGDLELVQLSDTGSVDLSSLNEADDVSIRGSWLDIKVGSLKTVNLGTQFCASQDCSIYGPKRHFPYIDVDLPSLEKTDYFEVAGAVKSVSVPKLEVVGYVVWPSSDYFPRQGLRINIEDTKDNRLEFNAPNLHILNGSIEAYGGLSRSAIVLESHPSWAVRSPIMFSLSLGSLGKTNVRAELNTDIPLSFYSTIETAQEFNIWGKLRRYVATS
ncbi:hypothetical protein N7450_001560 [Penicillium hetheringtonii]|uniref:Receptor L-domain domain-containing protein n=1 Tax=Penicillium hetheringtonii TaxID=911720 RepID=A0AAD6E5K8_9EURO|nr:hypothetical protein N7450_001560 [Penicillium hetheringtonii]